MPIFALTFTDPHGRWNVLHCVADSIEDAVEKSEVIAGICGGRPKGAYPVEKWLAQETQIREWNVEDVVEQRVFDADIKRLRAELVANPSESDAILVKIDQRRAAYDNLITERTMARHGRAAS